MIMAGEQVRLVLLLASDLASCVCTSMYSLEHLIVHDSCMRPHAPHDIDVRVDMLQCIPHLHNDMYILIVFGATILLLLLCQTYA